MPNSLTISAEPGQLYILVTGSGLWTPDQVETHFRKLDGDLRVVRRRAGVARVLVDLGKAKVQTAEAAERMHHWTARIYRAGDQVAVICETALLAMQIKHQAKIYNRRIFPDREAAMAWLLSDTAPRVAESA
ncbi:MAG: hypothetical protein J7494_01155 [Sphingobium sp.]|nr:hypothetical protein [Sphingobium sp.]